MNWQVRYSGVTATAMTCATEKSFSKNYALPKETILEFHLVEARRRHTMEPTKENTERREVGEARALPGGWWPWA